MIHIYVLVQNVKIPPCLKDLSLKQMKAEAPSRVTLHKLQI